MKKDNVIKKLEKEGYNIIYKKIDYWNNIPCVEVASDKGVSYLALESYIINKKYNNFTIDYKESTTFNQIKDKINFIKNNGLGYEEYYYINTIMYDENGRKRIVEGTGIDF